MSKVEKKYPDSRKKKKKIQNTRKLHTQRYIAAGKDTLASWYGSFIGKSKKRVWKMTRLSL